MSGRSSLRSQLVIGAALWTGGVSAVVAVLVPLLMLHYPHQLKFVHWTVMGFSAVMFMLAGLWQVRRGMSPIDRLHDRLLAVRDGRAPRVEGAYPAEVQPLVGDLNALLDDRDRRVHRAQTRAGDLAHGLKTPLAVLSQEAERAARAGNAEAAAIIGQQVERMRRQVEYHLANTRLLTAGPTLGVRSRVKDTAEALARTLLRLHADRGLSIAVPVPAGIAVRVHREDLEEMLGNLLDNACKWARAAVTATASAEGPLAVILVDDDGPGLPEAMREKVLQRGVRADESAPGSGLGLAIVRDLADQYGGAIALEAAPSGGVRAVLKLPLAL